MLIDSHCHLQFNAYKDDADEVIRRSLAENILMIAVGSQASTSKRGIKYAKKYPEKIWAAVGLHPIHLTEQEVDEEEIHFKSREEKFDYNFYKKLAMDPKVVGIGETGFDFFHLPKNIALPEIEKRQAEVFESHCELANELNLPLILHCREAHSALLSRLTKIIQEGKLKSRGVAHCFSGNWAVAKQYLDLGFYLGFTGIITFESRTSQRKKMETLWEVVKKSPLDRILIETDAPYLAPEPHRGKRNEPLFVKFIAEKIAQLKNLSYDEAAEQTFKNTLNLFKKIKI